MSPVTFVIPSRLDDGSAGSPVTIALVGQQVLIDGRPLRWSDADGIQREDMPAEALRQLHQLLARGDLIAIDGGASLIHRMAQSAGKTATARRK